MTNAIANVVMFAAAMAFIFIMSYAFASIGEPRSVWFLGLFGITL